MCLYIIYGYDIECQLEKTINNMEENRTEKYVTKLNPAYIYNRGRAAARPLCFAYSVSVAADSAAVLLRRLRRLRLERRSGSAFSTRWRYASAASEVAS